MVFSSGEDDFDKKESEVALIDESKMTRQIGGDVMDVHQHGFEFELEFWPVEHPVEPPDEDRPVKCPIPTSSLINDRRMPEERYAESLRKRPEVTTVGNKEGFVVAAPEPPVRALRKRHHTLTQGDYIITPLARMPPAPPLPTQNVTIFQMLQEFGDDFEN